MPIKPNTALPKGGKLLPPFKKTVGRWLEMEFDAEVICAGVRWLRVKDGMGKRGDREDWVADIPHCSASVHDYQFREPRWGFYQYRSFEHACAEQLTDSLMAAEAQLSELEKQLKTLRRHVRQYSKIKNSIRRVR